LGQLVVVGAAPIRVSFRFAERTAAPKRLPAGRPREGASGAERRMIHGRGSWAIG
jgi:hypothetical protein